MARKKQTKGEKSQKIEKVLDIKDYKKVDGEVIKKKKTSKSKDKQDLIIGSEKSEEVIDDNHEDHEQVLICKHQLVEIFEENDWLHFELAKEHSIRKNLEKLFNKFLKMNSIKQ